MKFELTVTSDWANDLQIVLCVHFKLKILLEKDN